MQTFLPYKHFQSTAECLDYKRLGKQRVEALQIHNIVSGKRTTGGWLNHPAVTMWKGYSDALAIYHNVMIQEWTRRGYNNNMPYIQLEQPEYIVELPDWLGDIRLLSSHKGILLRIDFDFISQYQRNEDPTMVYIWPGETRL